MFSTPSRTDGYPTPTLREQQQTEIVLRQYIPRSSDDPKPFLQRNLHLQWLARNFSQGLPERAISQAASQPWLCFWTIQGFYTLGAALDPENRQRCIDTIMACQHQDGGFGGGPKQNHHLLGTYAAVTALACVGRPGPNGGWDQIDRKKMYSFFMSLKQPDGSFLVSEDSEVDVRGIYCLLCVAYLLNLLTPELVAGTAEFIASLQTFEGGFASASQPFYSASPPSPSSLLEYPRPPLGEAHGGYTFCALASWVLLKPFIDKQEKKPDINVKTLTRWLTMMQGSEAELAGFKGRTNKLVDACYSWWVAGCFPLLRSLGVAVTQQHEEPLEGAEGEEESEGSWSDVDDDRQDLFDRIGLQNYLLYAGQHPLGGLRDKPPKPSDAYHTLYSLSGLATAQHRVSPSDKVHEEICQRWKPVEDDAQIDEMHKLAFAHARAWLEDPGGSVYAGTPADRVNAMHPIFNITTTHLREILGHFYHQP